MDKQAEHTVTVDLDWPHLIAVASEGLDVSQRFGMCTNYNYYRVVDGCIADSQNLPAKGKVGEYFAKLFSQLDVDVVIIGDMSDQACGEFTSRGIAIVRGASGRAIQAAQDLLDGKLDITPASDCSPASL